MARRMPTRAAFLALALLVAGCGASAPTPSGSVPSEGPGTSGSPPATPGAADDAAAVGQAFVEAIAAGDLAAAEAMEDEAMRAAAPAAALGVIWSQLVDQFGAFERFGDVETQEQPPYTRATVPAVFENATVPLLVTIAEDGRVAGFHLGPPGAPASPAAYIDPDAFTESEVTVGAAPWELPGTLAMPVGDGPFPAIVLLAGSGPTDRDGTVGVNAPLRDLAQGLASNGIAVLRYDKRTRAHPQEMAAAAETITVREEVVDDAVVAIDLLRSTPGIDPDRVFLAGHSLGGHLAPRVAAEAPGALAGIALLAANSSSLGSLILDQYAYLAGLGQLGPDPEAQLAELREQVARAQSPDLSPTTPTSDLPLGIPAAYWLDLRAYDPLATVADLEVPMLFVQGGRDYQVPPSELDAWRAALAGREDVTFREYPGLNHLLLAGSGQSRPAEYSEPGHVAPEVVADLAAWILAR